MSDAHLCYTSSIGGIMPVYPKTTTVISIEHAGRTATVDKVAHSPDGYSHYFVSVPTRIVDRYDWGDVDLDMPVGIDTGTDSVHFGTGHVAVRNVDEYGRRLPGDTSRPDAGVWTPADVRRHTRRLVDRVADVESRLGALWEFGSVA